jgi:hypothetical protein
MAFTKPKNPLPDFLLFAPKMVYQVVLCVNCRRKAFEFGKRVPRNFDGDYELTLRMCQSCFDKNKMVSFLNEYFAVTLLFS